MKTGLSDITLSEEDYILDMHKAGEGLQAISGILGLPLTAVKLVLIQHKRIKQLDDAVKGEICRRYMAGETRDQLAEYYHTSKNMITIILNRAKVPAQIAKSQISPARTRRINRVYESLPAATVREICDLRNTGMHKNRIAQRLGLSRAVIDSIPVNL